jgi:peptidoglycan/LPS O-acetylase OafA/YrhL
MTSTIKESGNCDDVLGQKLLPSLNGLRFVAVLFVVLSHAGVYSFFVDSVTFFLVLSGFLFTVLLNREIESTGTINLKSFYARRTIRILPAVYVCVIFTIASKQLLGLPVAWGHAASAVTFTTNYYNAAFDHPATGFSSLWSMALQEQFYLLWPMTFLLLARCGRQQVVMALATIAIMSGVWRCCGMYSGGSAAYAYNAFETRVDSLAIGCLTGLLTTSIGFRRTFSRITRTGLEPILPLAGLYMLSLVNETDRLATGFTYQSVLLGVLLLQLIQLHRNPLWSWLNSRVMDFLGTLAFSAYLYHHWGISLGNQVGSSIWISATVSIAGTFILAAGSYYLIERPFVAFRQRLRPQGQRSAQTANEAKPALSRFNIARSMTTTLRQGSSHFRVHDAGFGPPAA